MPPFFYSFAASHNGQKGSPQRLLTQTPAVSLISALARSPSARADADSFGVLCGPVELHHGRLYVMTSRTFEGAEIEPWLIQRDARQKHWCRALWALWPCINWRVFKR